MQQPISWIDTSRYDSFGNMMMNTGMDCKARLQLSGHFSYRDACRLVEVLHVVSSTLIQLWYVEWLLLHHTDTRLDWNHLVWHIHGGAILFLSVRHKSKPTATWNLAHQGEDRTGKKHWESLGKKQPCSILFAYNRAHQVAGVWSFNSLVPRPMTC